MLALTVLQVIGSLQLSSVMKKSKVVYIINHAAFFVSHRLPLAIGARSAGLDVALITGQAGSSVMEGLATDELDVLNIEHKRTLFRSSGLNPLMEFIGFIQIIINIFRLKPDIIHCASPKGILYGGIAARLCRVRGVVLAISGMGYLFSSDGQRSFKIKCLKWLYDKLIRIAFNNAKTHLIVQNHDDKAWVVNDGLANKNNVTLVPGSGVDLRLYIDCNLDKKKKIILLPARMIKDKGVAEFVAAARIIKSVLPSWQFVLAGAAGYSNPLAITEVQLKEWEQEGIVKWLGHVDNMVPLYKEASIVCLPSYYREGMPKALLEASAAGCAIVTTDSTGCREAIIPGVTGDLVPPKDVYGLAAALLALINDPARMKIYGINAQAHARENFSIDYVVNVTNHIYERLLND